MENLPDLVLRAEAVDALSVDDTARVVKSLERPLGGCMMLSGVLVDRTFTSQSQETFEAPFVPKSHAFQVLEQVISIESLDFIIGFTSISGLLGNAGQTNYARQAIIHTHPPAVTDILLSANTALTGLLHKYKNAMALVTPGILDTRQFLLQDAFTNQRLRHISSWGMLASGAYISKRRYHTGLKRVTYFQSFVSTSRMPSSNYAKAQFGNTFPISTGGLCKLIPDPTPCTNTLYLMNSRSRPTVKETRPVASAVLCVGSLTSHLRI